MEAKTLSAIGDTLVVVKQWENLKFESDSVGDPIDVSNVSEISVQVDNELGEKGSVLIEGSIDKINFHILKDNQGLPLRIRKKGIYSVGDTVRSIRPSVADGDKNTNVSVSIIGWRVQ